MGWLGWTEEETLNTTLSAIELAYEGKVDMLKLCFGAPEEEKPEEDFKPATPQNVRRILDGMIERDKKKSRNG